MPKNNPIQYYVEGKDEKKFLNVLKTELRLILPGKVDQFNAVEQTITDARLMALSPKTTVVLVFDTDTGKEDILSQNIKKLRSSSRVIRVITIPQVKNLEDELKRSCNIKDAKELLGCKSLQDFKAEFIRVSNLNLKNKLLQHGFRFDKLWTKTPTATYRGIQNEADKIRL